MDSLQPDGTTKREHYLKIEELTKQPLLAPPATSELGQYWLGLFWNLSASRGNNGFSPNPLSSLEINAWQHLMGLSLPLGAIELFRHLDYVFLRETQKNNKDR